MKQDELKLVLEALKWCHGGEPCGTAEAIAVVENAWAQRTWAGWTEDEIEILFQSASDADEEVHIRFARAIESKMKERNDHGI